MKTDKTENKEKMEKKDKNEKVVKSEKTEQTVNVEKTEKSETKEKTVKAEKKEKSETKEKAAKAEKKEKAEKAEKTAKAGKEVSDEYLAYVKERRKRRRNELKKALLAQLKAMIFPLCMLALILVAVYFIVNIEVNEEHEAVVRPNKYEGSDQPMILENNDLKFTFDPITTHFTVEVKKTGKIWSSNPENASTDPIAMASEKGKLNSTLIMSYSQDNGSVTTFNNYENSIEKGVYEITAEKDYIKVNYSIGNVEKEYIIPPVTTEERFHYWTEKMSKDALHMVQQYYKKYDINKPGKKDDVEALKQNYPIYEQEVIYVLRDNTTPNLKLKMEEYFEEIGYTMEDFEADKELSQAEASSDKAVFNIAMYYRLDGKDLIVEIPYSEMQYAKKTPIYTVSPLPYFGAGSTKDEGFLLVPEGGGGLINFNNGKVAQNNYYANMYGWDMALVREAVVHNTRAYFNTYGISQGKDSFLCLLEDGASYAAVQADISGRFNSYNFVNAVYNVTLREQYNVGGMASSSVYVFLPKLPDESIIQRYRFVDSGKYTDMAKAYRDYLKANDADCYEMATVNEAPAVVEIVSAVDKVKQILGVPTSRPLKMTTYKEAQSIIEELNNSGFKNLSVKLTGWMNGGVNQKILKKVKTIRACGSKKDLQNLTNAAKNLNVDLYLDGVTQYEYDSNLLNGFNSYTDAARFISKERAKLYQYSMVTYAAREGADDFYLLHAGLAHQMADNLYNTVKSYNANISFRETGMDLSGDYYRKNTVSREAVRKDQMEQLSQISADTKVMINMGNDYAMKYSDVITNMDLCGTEYTLIDEFVPFYQMAIHGYKVYTGDALNLASDSAEELLKSAEYGAGLYYTVMKESPFALQKTLYTQYFGSSYDIWKERMTTTYQRYNKELGHVFKQEMSDHKIIEKDLTCTTYADGTKVYVNYSYEDKKADGKKIPARDYLVVR